MNEYRGKHAPSRPWPVASSASVPSRRGRHQKKNRRRRFGLFVLLVFILLLVAYPFIEPKIITVNHIRINDPESKEYRGSGIHLPSNMEYLRIVYVSDIHWGHWFSDWDLGRLVKQINNLYPDIVILGGDYATDFESAVIFFNRLQENRLRAKLMIYGVLGETDYIGDDINMSRLRDAMKNAGITPLINEADTVSLISAGITNDYGIEEGKICVVGVDDVLSGAPDLKSLAYSGKVSSSEYVILAAHNPSVIQMAQKQINSEWFELGLFGHTHGGQVRFLSDLLDLSDEVPERYREGTYQENRSILLISHGVGTSVVPCRFLCFPQINCIDVFPD